MPDCGVIRLDSSSCLRDKTSLFNLCLSQEKLTGNTDRNRAEARRLHYSDDRKARWYSSNRAIIYFKESFCYVVIVL